MKKILSLVLSIVLLFSVVQLRTFNITVSAADYTEGHYTYTISNGEAAITDVNTSISGDVTIPSILGGYSVTSIGDNAFSFCESITSITIPDSVTSIGNYSFNFCTNIIRVTIPNSVTSIGVSSFRMCEKLKTITIPDSVISIGDYVFQYCYLLTSVTIPDSVISIGRLPFQDCKSLISITVNESNPSYCSVDGVLFDKNKNILICYPSQKSNVSYNVPTSVKYIAEWAFTYCTNLTSVILPNSVTSLGDAAFGACSNISSLTIGTSLKKIGNSAFYNCIHLENIWYVGSEVQKNNILIGASNDNLISANWYYNSGSCFSGELHQLTYHKKINPSCKYEGTIEHWLCDKCHGLFLDANGITAIGESDLVIQKDNNNHIGQTYIDGQKEPTCIELGYTGDTYCEDCGVKIKDGEIIPTTDHKTAEVAAKDATHEADGNIKYYTCFNCSSLFADAEAKTKIKAEDTIITKYGHDYGITYVTDADNHWKACTCGNIIDKDAHNYGEWTVTKEATASEKGSKEKICSICKCKETEEIPVVERTNIETNSPKTGDNSNIVLWVALFFISGSALITLIAVERKRMVVRR